MPTPNQWSIALPHTETSTTTAIRRGIDQDANIVSSISPPLKDGCQTLYEAIRRGLQLNPQGNCLGFYSTSNEEEGGSCFVYWNYQQVVDKIDAIAAGLKNLELMIRNEEGLLLVCMQYVLLVLKNSVLTVIFSFRHSSWESI